MTTSENAQLPFAVCISNENYPASLEVGKLYQIIPDEAAESHGYILVIDESGEDYGYSRDRIFPIQIPAALQECFTECSLRTVW